MPPYIALLRAVNVGGRTYKMAELRDHLTASGLEDVETYIQTGNVRFATTMRSRAKVEAHVEKAMLEGRGLNVLTVILTPAELAEVHAGAMAIDDPFGKRSGSRYVSFFKEPPSASVKAAIEAHDVAGERGWVRGRAVHVWITSRMMDAEFFDVFKKALLPGTNRNLKVVTTLAERWGS